MFSPYDSKHILSELKISLYYSFCPSISHLKIKIKNTAQWKKAHGGKSSPVRSCLVRAECLFSVCLHTLSLRCGSRSSRERFYLHLKRWVKKHRQRSCQDEDETLTWNQSYCILLFLTRPFKKHWPSDQKTSVSLWLNKSSMSELRGRRVLVLSVALLRLVDPECINLLIRITTVMKNTEFISM